MKNKKFLSLILVIAMIFTTVAVVFATQPNESTIAEEMPIDEFDEISAWRFQLIAENYIRYFYSTGREQEFLSALLDKDSEGVIIDHRTLFEIALRMFDENNNPDYGTRLDSVENDEVLNNLDFQDIYEEVTLGDLVETEFEWTLDLDIDTIRRPIQDEIQELQAINIENRENFELITEAHANARIWYANYREELAQLNQERADIMATDEIMPLSMPLTLTNQAPMVETGDFHSVYLNADGDVYSWGIYVGFTYYAHYVIENEEPTRVQGLPNNIVAVSAGGGHSLALTSAGTVYGWGMNLDGQTGGDDIDTLIPTRVRRSDGTDLQDIVAISAGGNHSLALTSNGTVYAWGANWAGQLGNGRISGAMWDGGTNPAAQVLNLSSVIAISAGDMHNLALLSNGTVRVWGSQTTSLSPINVLHQNGSALTGITAISAGLNHNLALRNTGEVVAWGSNMQGQLGNGQTSDWNVFTDRANYVVNVGGAGRLQNVSTVSAGINHSSVISNNGEVFAWGFNFNGQLGNGNRTNATRPTLASGISNVSSISAGASHTIALRNDESVWGVGSNHYYQLGVAGIDQSATWVEIIEGISPITLHPAVNLSTRHDRGLQPQNADSYRSPNANGLNWHDSNGNRLIIGTDAASSNQNGAHRETYMRFDVTTEQVQAIRNVSGDDRIRFNLFVTQTVGTAVQRHIDLHLLPADRAGLVTTTYPSRANPPQLGTWMSAYDAFRAGITAREHFRYNIVRPDAQSDVITNWTQTSPMTVNRFVSFDLTDALQKYFNENPNARSFAFVLSNLRGNGLMIALAYRHSTPVHQRPYLTIPGSVAPPTVSVSTIDPEVNLFVRSDLGLNAQTRADIVIGGNGNVTQPTNADLVIGQNHLANNSRGAYRETIMSFNLSVEEIAGIMNASGRGNDRALLNLFVTNPPADNPASFGIAQSRAINVRVVHDNAIRHSMTYLDAFEVGITAREHFRTNPDAVSEHIFLDGSSQAYTRLNRFFEIDLTAALQRHFRENPNARSFGVVLYNLDGNALMVTSSTRQTEANANRRPTLVVPVGNPDDLPPQHTHRTIEEIFPDSSLANAVASALRGNGPVGSWTLESPVIQADLDRVTTLGGSHVGIRGISNLEGMQYLTNLTEFRATGPTIEAFGAVIEDAYDDESLSESYDLYSFEQSLEYLVEIEETANVEALFGNTTGEIRDLSPLSGLIYLHTLDLTNNLINDISPLYGLTALRNLTLEHNQIRCIEPLRGLANLRYLHLNHNQIENISALAGMTGLDRVFLNNNRISNISPLTLLNLQRLEVNNQDVTVGVVWTNPLVFENNIRNINNILVAPLSNLISNGGTHNNGLITWNNLSDNLNNVSYPWNQSIIIGGRNVGLFSGRVTLPFVEPFDIFEFGIQLNRYKNMVLALAERALDNGDVQLSQEIYNRFELAFETDLQLHEMPEFLIAALNAPNYDDLVKAYFATKRNEFEALRQEYRDIIAEFSLLLPHSANAMTLNSDIAESQSSEEDMSFNPDNFLNISTSRRQSIPDIQPNVGAMMPIINIDEFSITEATIVEVVEPTAYAGMVDVVPMSMLPSLVINRQRTNSTTIVFDVRFPTSGANGNLIGLWDFNQGGTVTRVVGGNTNRGYITNRQDGEYTINSTANGGSINLQPGGAYVISVQWNSGGTTQSRFWRIYLPRAPHDTNETLVRRESRDRVIVAYLEQADINSAGTHFNTWLNNMEQVYFDMRILTGHTPYGGNPIEIRSTRQDLNRDINPDGKNYWDWIVGIAGNPTFISQPFYRAHMLRVGNRTGGVHDWGHIVVHEIVHAFDLEEAFDREALNYFKMAFVLERNQQSANMSSIYHIGTMRHYNHQTFRNFLRSEALNSYNNTFNPSLTGRDRRYSSIGMASVLTEIRHAIGPTALGLGWTPFQRVFNDMRNNLTPEELYYIYVNPNQPERMAMFNVFMTRLDTWATNVNVFNLLEPYRMVIENEFRGRMGRFSGTSSGNIIGAGGRRNLSLDANGGYLIRRFTPSQTANYIISTNRFGGTGPLNNTNVEVFRDENLSNRVNMTNEPSNNEGFMRGTVHLTANQTYYIRISNRNNNRLHAELGITRVVAQQQLTLNAPRDIIVPNMEYVVFRVGPRERGNHVFAVSPHGGGQQQTNQRNVIIELFNNSNMVRNSRTVSSQFRAGEFPHIVANLTENGTYYVRVSGFLGRRAEARVVMRRHFPATVHNFFDYGYSLFYNNETLATSRAHITERQNWANGVFLRIFGLDITTNTPTRYETTADRCRRTNVAREQGSTVNRPITERIGGLERTNDVNAVLHRCPGNNCDHGGSNASRCTHPDRMWDDLINNSRHQIPTGNAIIRTHVLWSGHQLDPFTLTAGTYGNRSFLRGGIGASQNHVGMISRPGRTDATDRRNRQKFILLHELAHAYGAVDHYCNDDSLPPNHPGGCGIDLCWRHNRAAGHIENCVMGMPISNITTWAYADMFCDFCTNSILTSLARPR
ncbi:MAG: leucine-rich repeat domain-containing protein [Oscillospiraceae bacterium]|nr:leucine-rich repeat domain-containing protein [Oscillospiraceae bacterium]